MTDREKVIKGITHHKLGLCDMSGKICPYWEEEADCTRNMLGDVLALVKEQEQAMKEKNGTISNLIAQIKEISQCYERVVRCKDCKHGRMINILNYTCTESQNHCEHILHSPDWFCADGRKKDD